MSELLDWIQEQIERCIALSSVAATVNPTSRPSPRPTSRPTNAQSKYSGKGSKTGTKGAKNGLTGRSSKSENGSNTMPVASSAIDSMKALSIKTVVTEHDPSRKRTRKNNNVN